MAPHLSYLGCSVRCWIGLSWGFHNWYYRRKLGALHWFPPKPTINRHRCSSTWTSATILQCYYPLLPFWDDDSCHRCCFISISKRCHFYHHCSMCELLPQSSIVSIYAARTSAFTDAVLRHRYLPSTPLSQPTSAIVSPWLCCDELLNSKTVWDNIISCYNLHYLF